MWTVFNEKHDEKRNFRSTKQTKENAIKHKGAFTRTGRCYREKAVY